MPLHSTKAAQLSGNPLARFSINATAQSDDLRNSFGRNYCANAPCNIPSGAAMRSLPPAVQSVIKHALKSMRADPQHQLLPIYRLPIYQTLRSAFGTVVPD